MKFNVEFLILLIIFMINFNCVQNTSKFKAQIINTSNNCVEFKSHNKNTYLDKVFEESKFPINSNTTYFLFFSSKSYF